MQHICRGTSMPKYDFNKVAKLQSNCIEIALRHGCFPVNVLHIFRVPFLKTTLEGLFPILPLYHHLQHCMSANMKCCFNAKQISSCQGVSKFFAIATLLQHRQVKVVTNVSVALIQSYCKSQYDSYFLRNTWFVKKTKIYFLQ